jgi:DNA-binding MarR family transcriptional regulator
VPGETTTSADPGVLATRLRAEMGRLRRQIRQHSRESLTPSQLSVLGSLDQQGPMRLGDLARVEVMAPPTLTKVVAALEERGLVTRTSDPADRRSALVAVSSAGRRELRTVRNERTAYLVRCLEALSPSELARLADAVDLLARLAEPEDGT